MHLSLLWKFIDDHSTANPELNGTYRIFGAVSDEYPSVEFHANVPQFVAKVLPVFSHYLLFNNGIKNLSPCCAHNFAAVSICLF